MAAASDSRAPLCPNNIENGETVYQRCLLVTGTCHDCQHPDDFVAVKVKDVFNLSSSQQNWPAYGGAFRCLVMLHAGPNTVQLDLYHKGQVCSSSSIVINYQPLLQLPPLHLAIVVACDSPLLIDCPPAKQGAISSAHSTLDAAVVKLRMAAYMWQALTAEDFRRRGLGRRTFRLDEEWGLDTTTSASSRRDSPDGYMDNVAKVHIVRSEKTVAELRDPSFVNPNQRGRDNLTETFEPALLAYGSPFSASNKPITAAMILDSHWSIGRGLVLANRNSSRRAYSKLPLGLFGSHTTYAWPRFLEEIPSCLLDRTPIGDTVANDHGQCFTMRDACCLGQGSMFYFVRKALDNEDLADHAPFPWHTTSMLSWSNAFVSQPHPQQTILWDLQSALLMMRREQFRLPGDKKKLTTAEEDGVTTIECSLNEKDEAALQVVCMAGIARIRFNGESKKEIDFLTRGPNEPDIFSVSCPAMYMLSSEMLEEKLGRGTNSEVEVLGMHGKVQKMGNVWQVLADRPFLKVPGTSLVLAKRCAKKAIASTTAVRGWAFLLRKRSTTHPSRFATANRVEICVGSWMDGVVVHYDDGSRCNCGKAEQQHYGGHHQSRHLAADEVFQINQVALNIGSQHHSRELYGCRMTLAGDVGGETSWGNLNDGHHSHGSVTRLVCRPDERIIGFYGKSSESGGYTHEFGIITAPRAVVDSEEGLPDEVYSMPELMNNHGGPSQQQNHDSDEVSDEDMDDDDDSDGI